MNKSTTLQDGGVGERALHLTIAKATTVFISLISGMLLSRFRTVEEYGTYSQLLIVVTLMTSLLMMGLPNSINYFLARADEGKERKEFLSIYYTLNTVLCVVIGAVLIIAIPWIERYFENEGIRKFWYFLAFYPWARITISGVSNVLVVYGKTKRLMVINILTALVALVSVIVIQFSGLSFREYILTYLGGHLVLSCWIYVMIYRLEGGLSCSLKIGMVKKIFAYSIPIGLASLVGTVSIEMDKLMIGKFMDTEALAYYTNAGRELPLTFVAASLTAVLLPQMARKLKENKVSEAVGLWGTSIELSYIIICFCSTACIVFAPQIMTLLYSEKYLAGVGVFRVYALVLLLRTTYFGLMLNSIGKTRLIFWASVLSLGLNGALNYLLFRLMGFVGPAVASLTSVLFVNLLQLGITAKLIRVPFRHIFPWKALGAVTAVNVCWGIFMMGIICVLKITTDWNSIVLAIGMGFVITIGYAVTFRKRLTHLWNMLNAVNG